MFPGTLTNTLVPIWLPFSKTHDQNAAKFETWVGYIIGEVFLCEETLHPIWQPKYNTCVMEHIKDAEPLGM